MQKIFAVLVLVLGFSGAWAGVCVPPGYKKIESRGDGFIVYKKGNLYVTVVDLRKMEVTFSGYHKASSGNSFYKYKLNEWWNPFDVRLLAIFNGQFFNIRKNPTPLSFPLRTKWKTIVTYVDSGRSLKTLKIYSNGKEAQIYDGYYYSDLKNSKELIVGLDPSENKSSRYSIGRFYIAGLHNQSSTLRYLLFFISENKTQDDMLSEIYNWGVWDQDIIMMDGSGSAQMKTNKITVYGSNYPVVYHPDYRTIPNIILVREK